MRACIHNKMLHDKVVWSDLEKKRKEKGRLILLLLKPKQYSIGVPPTYPMHRQMQVSAVPRAWLLIFFLLAVFHGDRAEANNKEVTGIGVIIDVKTRKGKEEKTAMEVAAQNYNNSNTKTHKVHLHFRDALRVASVGKLLLGKFHIVPSNF